MDKDYSLIGLITFFLLILVLYFSTMHGCGYHLKYSWINGKWVWVNAEGRP